MVWFEQLRQASGFEPMRNTCRKAEKKLLAVKSLVFSRVTNVKGAWRVILEEVERIYRFCDE